MPVSEVLYKHDSNNFTPDEPWTVKREHNHWYSLQADWAQKSLGSGPGKFLIIGSPIFEALEFKDLGWEITYVDVRKPPVEINHLHGDISKMPLPVSTYDAVSSTCVLCHVGMGRYGDSEVEDAEIKVLEKIHQTLKPGGLAAITFGPVSKAPFQIRLSNMERIFTLDSAKRASLQAGFKIENMAILDTKTALWVPEIEEETNRLDRHYLSMLLRK